MLKATALSKKYGELSVLNQVSLTIDSNEFVTIVGPSGAGKSTLLHLLSSLDTPDSGEVYIEEQIISKLSSKQQAHFRNQNFGFVFQFHHLLPEFTALENVSLPLLIANVSKKEAEAKAKAILERVGLAHRIGHKPTEMSGGEQQRVAIARALVHTPKYIFADEPTGNLDSANAQAIHQLFLDIQKEYQLTLIIVTHNETLAPLAHRTFVMKDGRIETILQNHLKS